MITTLAAHAEKTARQGRPAAESLRAAREAGAFALATPVAYGGRGATATEITRTLAAMGRACPSTAWVAGTCLTGKALAAAVDYDEQARKEFFADPDMLVCGSGKPGGTGTREPDGTVRITGRWDFVSGCEDAEWAGLGVMIDGTFSYVQIPLRALTVERTWDMAGMQGTGSHTVIADDVAVPAGRIAAFAPPGVATMQLFGLAVLAPVVGATFAALDLVVAMFATDRKPFMTPYASMGESPGARHWLAEATTLAQRAERTMLAVAAAVDAAGTDAAGTDAAGTDAAGTDAAFAAGTGASGSAGTVAGAAATAAGSAATLSDADGSRLHLNLSEAARDCRSAVELMLDLYGSGGFAASHPLQRLWRDVAVGSRHAHLNGYLAAERFARTVSGVS